MLKSALIDRQNGSFELAAVFSAITILVGVVITVTPVLMRWIAEWSMARKGGQHGLAAT